MRQLILKPTLACLFAALVLSACLPRTPHSEKLADCTNSIIRFELTVRTYPGYHFALGVPGSETNSLNFRGEVTISQSTGVVAAFPISSEDVVSCNWLGNLKGYVLTWSLTNRGEHLRERLVRGQTYDVEVQFSDMPPPTSSLWLGSIGRVGMK